MRRLAGLALCLGAACGGESRPPSPWVNLHALRLSRWGDVCGTDYTRHAYGGFVTKEWKTAIVGLRSDRHVTCSVTYRSLGRQLKTLSVAMVGVRRDEAERLYDLLVLPYLPLDLNLIARGAVMWSGNPPDYWNARVRISGGRVLSDEDSYSLMVAVPPR